MFQPRIGLAYALNSKTALRAGVGEFANRTAINRDTALGGNARFQPQFTLTIQDPVFKIPTAWNWNATFQRELPWSTTIEVGYVGGHGIHNQRKRNLNQLQPGTIQANSGVNPNAIRPHLGLGLERRLAKGLQFGLAYTLSKSTDNGSSLTDVLPNSYDDRGYYGRSDFDRTHVLIFTYI